MDPTEATAALNAMAGTTPRISPRKRLRISDQNEDFSDNKRAKATTQHPRQNVASPKRRSSNRLQQLSLPSTEPAAGHRGGAFTSSPELEATAQEGSLETLIKKPKKMVKLRNTKSSAPKDSPFRGHAFGSLNPLHNTKAQLTSLDSPAKSTRSRLNRVAANPLDALQNHPIIPKPVTEATSTITPKKRASGKPQSEISKIESPRRSNRKSVKQMETAYSPAELEQNDNVHSDRETNVPLGGSEDVIDDVEDMNATELTPKPKPEIAKRKGRKPRSEEEIKHKEEEKRAKQQRAADNMEESAKAEKEAFDNQCAKFMRGISDFARDMNLYEAWAAAGGAALTIRHIVSRKYDSNSVRAEAIMRQILRVTDLYADLEGGNLDPIESSRKMLDNIQVLRNRAEGSFLKPEIDPKTRHDPTVMELYQHLIPKLVVLLKQSLRTRYAGGLSRGSNKELLKLTKAGLNLCDVATAWQPSPTTLEHGIKRMVRIHIRPNLYKLWSYFARNETSMAQKEWEDQNSRELATRQAESQKLIMKRMLPKLGDPSLLLTKQRHDDVVNLEDIEAVKSQNQHERRQRQPTEEIPAPDPSIPWTDKENIALLNGLQEFLDGDRYTRILEKYPQLSNKDLDQIMAQAQFFKRVTERKIRTLESQGDHSLSWLSTIVL